MLDTDCGPKQPDQHPHLSVVYTSGKTLLFEWSEIGDAIRFYWCVVALPPAYADKKATLLSTLLRPFFLMHQLQMVDTFCSLSLSTYR